ncbi:hypothetical protein ACFX15_032407 [Malus domestica]
MELPGPNSPLTKLKQKFIAKSFTEVEMVALSSSYTIGRASCWFFQDLIYNNDNNMDHQKQSLLHHHFSHLPHIPTSPPIHCKCYISPCPRPFTNTLAPEPPLSSTESSKRLSPRRLNLEPPYSACTSTTTSCKVAMAPSCWTTLPPWKKRMAPFPTKIHSADSRSSMLLSSSSRMSAPDVVPCTDILALATKEGVMAVGEPNGTSSLTGGILWHPMPPPLWNYPAKALSQLIRGDGEMQVNCWQVNPAMA